MMLEHREGIGQEAGLVPHRGIFHRDYGDVVTADYALDLRLFLRRSRHDLRAGLGRAVGVLDENRHIVAARRLDAWWMKHLGAHRGELLRLTVTQSPQQARVRDGSRIGTENAGHIRPDLEFSRRQPGREVGGGGVRSTAAKQAGLPIRTGRDETLRDVQGARAGQTPLQHWVRLVVASRGQDIAGCRDRMQELAGVLPACVQPRGLQHLTPNAAGKQFTMRQQAGPLHIAQS